MLNPMNIRLKTDLLGFVVGLVVVLGLRGDA